MLLGEKQIKIEPNSNFHLIGDKSILYPEDAKFKKYRYEWINNPKQFKVAKFPLHLDIETTNICNLRCPYCATTYDGWAGNKKGKMSFELFKNIIDEVVKKGLYSIKLSLRGEPLLHEELQGMIEYAKTKKIIDVYFNTNGVLLNEEKSKQLIRAGLNRISISCDGWDKESFERNRRGAKFKVVYNNILNLRRLRKKMRVEYPKIRIQTVMLPGLREHWQEFLDLWQPLADEIGYLDARQESPGIDHKGLKANWACPFLWQRIVILWDGTILPCLLHGVKDSSSMEMGNVRKTNIKEQWLSERYNKYRELHKKGTSHRIEACNVCSYRASEIKKYQSG